MRKKSPVMLSVLSSFLLATVGKAATIIGFGFGGGGQLDIPAGNDFVAIAAEADHSIALREDGSIVAWGDNSLGQTDAPEGNDFVSIAAGRFFNVAIRADGSLDAWGSNSFGQTDVPAGNGFISAAAGNNFGVALHMDGSLAFWGIALNNLPTENGFTAVGIGASHIVALRPNGSLFVWGDNGNGQLNAPAGNDFVEIAVGDYHSLARRSNGSVVAWGRNFEGQSNPISGSDFTAIAASGVGNLGLKQDGSLAKLSRLVPVPPSGEEFSAIALGSSHGLALADNRIPEPSSAMICIALAGIVICTGRRNRANIFHLSPSCAVFALLVWLPSASQASYFIGLGDLPGGLTESAATGVSDNGTVVVGIGSTGNNGYEMPFRWTVESGITGLGNLPGSESTSFNQAENVSGDGSTIVGHYVLSNPETYSTSGFRWTSNSGLVAQEVPTGSNINHSVTHGVSFDGTVVVGLSRDGVGGPTEAYRWTATQGAVGLGFLSGGDSSSAWDVSANGTVVVGNASNGDGNSEAFRWTSTGGMVGLGDLSGGAFYSTASRVSADGNVVVGNSTYTGAHYPDTRDEAFRWTSNGGMVGLGFLSGGDSSRAADVSGDGSIVVGSGASANGYEAMIWTEAQGIRNLKDMLVNDIGLDLTDWFLFAATAISADGKTIVGAGINPNGDGVAWLANLNPITSLPGDFSHDGSVDAADYTVWRDTNGQQGVTSFSGADGNGDGQITANDYEVWKTNFGRGTASLTPETVPESSTAMLVLLSTVGLLAVISRSRRHKLVHQGCMVLAVTVGSSALLTQECQAAFFVTAEEIGDDVVIAGSGSFTAWQWDSDGFLFGSITPGASGFFDGVSINFGNTGGIASEVELSFASIDSFVVPATLGVDIPGIFASSFSGDPFGVSVSNYPDPEGALILSAPRNYVAGTELNGVMTFDGINLESMGLVPGAYVFSWTAGSITDTLTFEVTATVVPEPTTTSLAFLALTGLCLRGKYSKLFADRI